MYVFLSKLYLNRQTGSSMFRIADLNKEPCKCKSVARHILDKMKNKLNYCNTSLICWMCAILSVLLQDTSARLWQGKMFSFLASRVSAPNAFLLTAGAAFFHLLITTVWPNYILQSHTSTIDHQPHYLSVCFFHTHTHLFCLFYSTT